MVSLWGEGNAIAASETKVPAAAMIARRRRNSPLNLRPQR
jgi:hypothetical protein